MKFKDIIINSNWNDIEKLLLTLDENKDNLDGYKKVYDELMKLKPKSSDCVLTIKHIKNDDDEEEYEYEDVFGVSKKDKQNYALEFTPWQEWLGMEIDQKTLNKYSKPSIIANCIYEMTFYGFDQKKIKKKMDDLLKLRIDKSKRVILEDLKKEIESS